MAEDRIADLDNEVTAATEQFVSNVESLALCTGHTVRTLTLTLKSAHTEMRKFVEDRGGTIEDEYDPSAISEDNLKGVVASSFNLHVENYTNLAQMHGRATRLAQGVSLVPQAMLVAMLSQFDAFLGRLLGGLLRFQPGLLGNSREVRVSEVLNHKTIEDFRQFLIDGEIEAILRLSYADQFAKMASKFDVKLEPRDELWRRFIELSQRRHLFVHADGIVSSQYISVCQTHKCDIGGAKEGKKLVVTPEYFRKSAHCLIELAVTLAQVLWRKISPQSLRAADNSLNSTCLDLIRNGDNTLAQQLLDFGCKVLKKWGDRHGEYCLVVNRWGFRSKANGVPV